jgi:hypothetical protein
MYVRGLKRITKQGGKHMRAQVILAFALFLAVRSVSQELPNPPRQAQCRFSDGSTITVTYSYERRNYIFATDGSLVTVNGVRVPTGDYAVSPAKDSDNKWTLTMRKPIIGKGYWVLPPLPMSVATSALRRGNFPVFFDQTGGSCMMYWGEKKSDTVLSLEFTKENADLPVMD